MHYCIVDTSIGAFGVAWTADGVARLALPGQSAAELVRRFDATSAHQAAPPAHMADLCRRITRYADGAADAFTDVRVDLAGVPEFHRRCYGLIRRLDWGETTTYGALARELGDVGLSRAVGVAMGANPVPLVLPCHRVVAADGRPGDFSAPGGVDAKLRLLALERAATPDGQLRLDL